MLALDHIESADAGADMHADVLRDLGRDLELRHLHRFIGSGDGEVNEAAHLLHFFFLDELERIEVADLGCDLAGEGGGVETGNAIDAAFAGDESLPHRLGGIAHRADQADAGNDHPTRQFESSPFLRFRR